MAQSRRDFLKTGVAATVLSGIGGAASLAQTSKRSATDWVTLGKSNVKVTRLAFGTGTFSGRVQRELGQAEFTRLVRYAYDHGIRFFETAESYHGMPEMLAIALKGIPRDSYKLMTKYRHGRLSTRVCRMDSRNPRERRSSWVMAPPFTGCRRCALSLGTSGSKSP